MRPARPVTLRDVRVYADGSALVRYLPGSPESEDWRRWASEHEPDLLVTSLSLNELRAAAAGQSAQVRALAHEVAGRLAEVRFSDQALKAASMSVSVLSPFGSLHLGVALTEPEVEALATYDPVLARVAQMYQLRVISPGRTGQWFA